jgi:hypothetical protein
VESTLERGTTTAVVSYGLLEYRYCIFGRDKINAWLARGAAARVSVNFRKFSACIARAGLTVYPPSQTLEPLAFDEYYRFGTSAFFWGIKQTSFYSPKESRSIKTATKTATSVILPQPRIQYC